MCVRAGVGWGGGIKIGLYPHSIKGANFCSCCVVQYDILSCYTGLRAENPFFPEIQEIRNRWGNYA